MEEALQLGLGGRSSSGSGEPSAAAAQNGESPPVRRPVGGGPACLPSSVSPQAVRLRRIACPQRSHPSLVACLHVVARVPLVAVLHVESVRAIVAGIAQRHQNDVYVMDFKVQTFHRSNMKTAPLQGTARSFCLLKTRGCQSDRSCF